MIQAAQGSNPRQNSQAVESVRRSQCLDDQAVTFWASGNGKPQANSQYNMKTSAQWHGVESDMFKVCRCDG